MVEFDFSVGDFNEFFEFVLTESGSAGGVMTAGAFSFDGPILTVPKHAVVGNEGEAMLGWASHPLQLKDQPNLVNQEANGTLIIDVSSFAGSTVFLMAKPTERAETKGVQRAELEILPNLGVRPTDGPTNLSVVVASVTVNASGDVSGVDPGVAEIRVDELGEIVAELSALGTLDHGNLNGLLDDDHTQYQLRSEQGDPNGYPTLDGSGCVSEAITAVKETDGPTTLTVGAVLDGEFLKRDGSTIVGDTPAGGGGGGFAPTAWALEFSSLHLIGSGFAAGPIPVVFDPKKQYIFSPIPNFFGLSPAGTITLNGVLSGTATVDFATMTPEFWSPRVSITDSVNGTFQSPDAFGAGGQPIVIDQGVVQVVSTIPVVSLSSVDFSDITFDPVTKAFTFTFTDSLLDVYFVIASRQVVP